MWFFRRKSHASFPLYVWLTAGVVVCLKGLFIFGSTLRGLGSTVWLIDDSFIEMRVAQNLALGNGFSLDGIHATTGAPFLWIHLSALNHLLFAKEMAIRATLIETAILGALATIVVFHLALKLTQDRRVAWTAFILSTFSANAFFNGMNGMDTALFTFLVLLTFATCLGVGRPAKWSAFSWGCVIGLMAGLTVMTRGDGIFVIFAIACLKFFEWWRATAGERKNIQATLFGILLISGICFAGFMTWQLVQTGSPFPGNQVGRRELAYAFHNFSFSDFSLVRYFRIVVWNIFQLEELISIATGSSLLLFAAFVSGCLHRHFRSLSILTTLYLGIFFALLVGYQWYFANLHGLRYINPAVHLFFIYLAFFVWQLPILFLKKWAAVFVIAAVLILSNYKFYQMCSRFPWAPYMSFVGDPDPAKSAEFWGTMDWMQANLKPGTIVGVRDYGRLAMFVDVTIQDIAGNIDPAANRALKDGTLDDYLRQRNVEYLLIPSLKQRSDALYQYLHANLLLEQVKEAPVSPTQTLYKIIW